MANLADIYARHSSYQDKMVATFEDHLREIVRRAQAHVIGELQKRLSITDGIIDATPANMRLLRKAGDMFMAEMKAAGYDRLVTAFVGEFHGTLPFLQETIEMLGEQVQQKWPSLDFTQKDLNLLAGVQVNVAVSLEDAISSVAGAAVTRGLFGVAALPFKDLVGMLTEKFETSIGKARTIADTGMSCYFATANDRAYQIIAKDVPELEMRFRYSGPLDLLCRPFCMKLMLANKSYTRGQIDAMDNGSLPNVFITRGSWNCRHSWVLDISDAEAAMKEAA